LDWISYIYRPIAGDNIGAFENMKMTRALFELALSYGKTMKK